MDHVKTGLIGPIKIKGDMSASRSSFNGEFDQTFEQVTNSREKQGIKEKYVLLCCILLTAQLNPQNFLGVHCPKSAVALLLLPVRRGTLS